MVKGRSNANSERRSGRSGARSRGRARATPRVGGPKSARRLLAELPVFGERERRAFEKSTSPMRIFES
jgi:hypothetical protein